LPTQAKTGLEWATRVPSPAAEKIRTIDTLAREISLRLEVN